MRNKTKFIIAAVLIYVLFPGTSLAQQIGFTQEDRERQIRMETTLHMFMEQTDKRFEELRADMNFRFEQVDKRFEQVDRRFEQVDKRFEQMMNFIWILVSIFTAMTIATIGFAFWDRRSYIRQAKEEAVQQIEKQSRLTHLIEALREIAPKYPELAASLRKFGLM